VDPLTQGAVGAIVAQSVARRGELCAATAAGFGAGLLADVDVFIRSARDPLLFLEFHRQFTHALVFVPVGAAVAALLLWPLLRGRLPAGRLYLFCLLGYATHGLLDACTTYGTQLFWPFSDARVAWGVVSVVDPAFTLPVLGLMLAALAWCRPALGRAAVVVALAYLSVGLVQRERADALLARVAESHWAAVERGGAKPSFGNLLLWRGVWQSGDRFHVVALRPGILGPDRVSPVASAPRFELARDAPALAPGDRQARDVARFERFSDGWLVRLPADHGVLVGDLRYAMLPDRIDPLWGIRLDPERPDAHARYVTRRSADAQTRARFGCMVLGTCLSPFAP
jgi:inner membrane protein